MYIKNGIAYAEEQKPPITVSSVRPLDDYKLWIRFNNGEEKVFDFASELERPAFSPLKDRTVFSSVYIDFGAPVWNDGEIDIAPEYLYAHGTSLDDITMTSKSKYNMSREQSVFLVRRNIVDYIHKSAKLEGLEVSYPTVHSIFDGVVTSSIKVSDVIAINNLKHAWYFLLDTLDCALDYPYLCKLNQLVGGDTLIYDGGYISELPVTIGRIAWTSEMSDEDSIKAKLLELQDIYNPITRAIELMLYCMRSQFFLNGNTRTAMLAANQIMVSNGQGVISVPVEYQEDFRQLFVSFYESGDSTAIARFIYDHCIDGMAF